MCSTKFLKKIIRSDWKFFVNNIVFLALDNPVFYTRTRIVDNGVGVPSRAFWRFEDVWIECWKMNVAVKFLLQYRKMLVLAESGKLYYLKMCLCWYINMCSSVNRVLEYQNLGVRKIWTQLNANDVLNFWFHPAWSVRWRWDFWHSWYCSFLIVVQCPTLLHQQAVHYCIVLGNREMAPQCRHNKWYHCPLVQLCRWSANGSDFINLLPSSGTVEAFEYV